MLKFYLKFYIIKIKQKNRLVNVKIKKSKIVLLILKLFNIKI